MQQLADQFVHFDTLDLPAATQIYRGCLNAHWKSQPIPPAMQLVPIIQGLRPAVIAAVNTPPPADQVAERVSILVTRYKKAPLADIQERAVELERIQQIETAAHAACASLLMRH